MWALWASVLMPYSSVCPTCTVIWGYALRRLLGVRGRGPAPYFRTGAVLCRAQGAVCSAHEWCAVFSYLLSMNGVG